MRTQHFAHILNHEPDVDWFIVLDTSEPERIGGYRELFFADGARRICIDHHRTHDRDRYQHELVVPEAPATGSLVLAVLDALNVKLTPAIARARSPSCAVASRNSRASCRWRTVRRPPS